ncbi:hypothetical protein [Flavobacterium silvaticum]|uniref:Uncharacterized protein n=1 Tax=Flavobacterium silvaticum TaxID=1852020 RepID=A0A972JIK7_9FLAO|nr:hypothetical protein [Flavobacterium silvaticum]NMH28363.1 hypothetical protein [Flavobacterium silvaticum]
MLFTSIAIFCVHMGLLYAFQIPWSVPEVSLISLYGFFFACALTIILAMIITKKKNRDAVGYTYLLSTSLQLALSYFMIRQALNHPDIDLTDKLNIGFVFAAFLLAETSIGMKMLDFNK